MELKGQISLTILSVSILALELSLNFFPASSSVPGEHVGARSADFRSLPELAVPLDPETILSVVSIHDAGEFPVVQQPAGESTFVSRNDGEVTQFASAARYGNVGLLAHNYLSGKSFSRIRIGQHIHLIYSDGRSEVFVVTEILRYRALEPKSPYSSFQNMEDQNEILTVAEMFDRAYQGGRHVTFQTCISAEGNSSWGRLFVIALPVSEPMSVESVSLVDFP